MAPGGASVSSSRGPMEPDDVTVLMKDLGLWEEDLEDVVLMRRRLRLRQRDG